VNIQEAGAAIRAGKTSSTALTEAALARIGEENPRINAIQTVMDDSALARARQADRELAGGTDLGPLHGIPIAVKDLFATKGVRTTGGSKLFENWVPDYDDAVVEKLRAAGAVIVGKCGMHELAYGVTSNNPHFGAVRNPCDPTCIPGGSSGGSAAAVAAGMAFAAMGSDTGGSIRIPASYCGVAGLKPTFGRVSKRGVMPLGYTLDHMGPLAATVRDCGLVLEAIAGYDRRDPSCAREPVQKYTPGEGCSISGLRVGMPENFFLERLDPEVDVAVRAAFFRAESLGAKIVPVRVPDIAALNAVGRVILLAEASAVLERYVTTRRGDIGPDVLSLIDQGRLIPATDYIQAQRLRTGMRREFLQLWKDIDVLCTPTTPITAPKIGALNVEIHGEMEDVRLATTRFMRGINVLGLPALSIPCGHDSRKMPIGLQIIGKAFQEAKVLRMGAALEDDMALTAITGGSLTPLGKPC
jgi:aspartyl-tRNA(Asn)/glutamyl-tRNA(Gln) amidotransferase subunit A